MTARTRVGLAVIAVVAAGAVAGGAYLVTSGDPDTAGPAVASGVAAGPSDAVLPVVDTAALVAGVDQSAAGKLTPVRLADGLVPPTNRWFSGLVFGDQPQPVFPLPLSFSLTADGFSLGLPKPVVSEKAIVGPHLPAVAVGAGATSARVSAYDAVTVTIELLDAGGGVIGRVVIAEGSPFVSFTSVTDTDLTLAVPFAAAASGAPVGSALATATVAGTQYAVVAPSGAIAAGGVRLSAGQSASWYAVPDGADASVSSALASAAVDPVVGSESTYGVDDTVARTTIGYRTATGGSTAYVTMPHQRAGKQPDRTDCGAASYPSVYGALELCTGSMLTSWAPVVPASGGLDLTSVPQDRLDVVRTQLAADVASTPAFPSDTYFGGKALYRAATLVTLGHSLGADDVVAPLKEKVVAALREWAQPDGCTQRQARCFVYDAAARGVIGLTPSFGSDEFNDHHFHYGYFLATAGLLAADDTALADELAPVMNLLAQDVAAARPSDQLPQLRVFDVYAGHSWASGTSPFADGNNQESTSEAVNAWNGLGLWAKASGQDALGVEATWLASTEAASARAYWTDPDLSEPVYQGFGHKIFALAWGGKRDYATWFSGEPSAILGIQLIPMNPAAGYLAGDPDRIRANVAEAAPGGYGVQFGDYLLMYLALAGPQDADRAWTTAQQLPDTAIDDGDSRAYLLAWLAAASTNPGGV
ncbi:1,3-beta-glucanase [Cellulomonas sp. WB94]|uniref:glycosyl hydrolase n=1 Tax=Cellulomonas sp. WB94 TaxID=2173174 RepID=UPI000D588915|nr:glycosyl hydrolase [Cellulomonas sp. WB94]PVU82682.1 1,3-beta-glucanase [Cellulomonas sp. WB94]